MSRCVIMYSMRFRSDGPGNPQALFVGIGYRSSTCLFYQPKRCLPIETELGEDCRCHQSGSADAVMTMDQDAGSSFDVLSERRRNSTKLRGRFGHAIIRNGDVRKGDTPLAACRLLQVEVEFVRFRRGEQRHDVFDTGAPPAAHRIAESNATRRVCRNGEPSAGQSARIQPEDIGARDSVHVCTRKGRR